MKSVVATGRTVEDAVTSALVRLGVTRSQATVKVITEPVRGFLGFLGGREAEVEVSVVSTPSEVGREFLSKALSKMGLEASVLVRGEGAEQEVQMEISCDEDLLPIVIGRHGSTLDALQYLTNVVVHRESEGRARVALDAGSYRRRRYETLCRMAHRAAERAVQSGRPVALDAMSSAERKVVHTYLQDRKDVSTASEGQEPNRRVIVSAMSRSARRKSMTSSPSRPKVQGMS